MSSSNARTSFDEMGSVGFLRLLQAGDERAYRGLETSFRPMIISIAARSGLSRDDADDVAQETLVAVFRSAASIANPAAIAGWIRTTAQREAWKARRRSHHLVPSHYAATVAGDLDEQLIRDETRVETITAMRALGQRDQVVLAMTVASDPPSPYVDVARRLGCAVGSIGAFRGRAMQRLAANLERTA